MFKLALLTEQPELQLRMAQEQKDDFNVPVTQLTFVLLVVVVGTLIFSGVILVILIGHEERRRRAEARAARARRLRRVSDDQEVLLEPLPPLEDLVLRAYPPGPPPSAPQAGPFHVFLSHNWQHGQTAMRIVKTRLRELLPDVEVFLGAARRLDPAADPSIVCSSSSEFDVVSPLAQMSITLAAAPTIRTLTSPASCCAISRRGGSLTIRACASSFVPSCARRR
jgi:hypothetical protein